MRDLGNRGRSVLENSAAQKKRGSEAGAECRSRFDRTFGDGRQRRRGRGFIASARVEHRGEALVLRVARVLMRPRVKPRRSGQQHRHDETCQRRAEKREAENR